MNSDVVLKNATALFASQDRHHRIRSMTQFGDILMGRHAGRSQANPRWKFRKVFAKALSNTWGWPRHKLSRMAFCRYATFGFPERYC